MIQNQIIQDKSICWGSVLKIIESDTQPTSWKLCFLNAVQSFEALCFELKVCLFNPLCQTSFVFVFYCFFVSVFASCFVFVSLRPTWSWRLSSSFGPYRHTSLGPWKKIIWEQRKNRTREGSWLRCHHLRVYSNYFSSNAPAVVWSLYLFKFKLIILHPRAKTYLLFYLCRNTRGLLE